jgi:hypothetical protein
MLTRTAANRDKQYNCSPFHHGLSPILTEHAEHDRSSGVMKAELQMFATTIFG